VSLKPSEINVDQTVQLASDQYEVALNGAEAFVNRGALSPATIETGFLDDDLQQNFLTNMTSGVIDEVELHVTPDDQTSVVRGRDAAALAIESSVYVTYVLNQPVQSAPTASAIPGFPSLPYTPGVTVPLPVFGKQTARDIAEDLCERVGLSVSFGAPNYRMRENFAVNGSVISALQQLVNPFNYFEPSAYDIWAEGGLVVIRSRETAGPGIDLDAHDARVTDLVIRARGLSSIRVLRLEGSRTGASGGVAVTGFDDTETVDELEEGGVIVSRIVTREHTRQIDRAVLSQTVETWKLDADDQLVLTAVDSIQSNWDAPEVVFPNTIVNSPKENERTITREGLDEDGNIVPVSRTRISQSYDEDGYLRAQNTTKEDWDADAASGAGQFVRSESETKTYRRSSMGSYQITTTQFDADGAPGATRRTTANGTPPGGPGRGVGSNADVTEEQVVYATVISNDPGARDITITNKNLLAEHLAIIAGQATRASGATEVEASFTAAGMPWIHRGQTLVLTGLDDDLGYDIPLQPFLVVEAKLEYRENSENPTYLTHVRGVFYDRSL
jgi:hypothetical protein